MLVKRPVWEVIQTTPLWCNGSTQDPHWGTFYIPRASSRTYQRGSKKIPLFISGFTYNPIIFWGFYKDQHCILQMKQKHKRKSKMDGLKGSQIHLHLKIPFETWINVWIFEGTLVLNNPCRSCLPKVFFFFFWLKRILDGTLHFKKKEC